MLCIATLELFIRRRTFGRFQLAGLRNEAAVSTYVHIPA